MNNKCQAYGSGKPLTGFVLSVNGTV